MISFFITVLLRDCVELPRQDYLVPQGRVDVFLDVERTEWVGQLIKPTCFRVLYLAKEVYVMKINYMGKDAYVHDGNYRVETKPGFGCNRLSVDVQGVRKMRSFPVPKTPVYRSSDYPAPVLW